jgi:ceramide glucosyltransferase
MQVYRKIWHLSFIWAPIAYYHWLENRDAVILSLIFLCLFVVLDLIRLNWNRGNVIAYRHFSWLLREQERKGFNTSIYFALSCFICALFFEKRVAVLCITVLCVGDPIAAIIGSKYGTVRILNKSLQGSLACFVSCFLVAQFLFEPTIAFWAAITATFFELISSRLNDNLSVPIFTGLMVTMLLESPQLTGPMQYFLLFGKVYLIFVVVTSLVGIGIKHYIMNYYVRHYASTFESDTKSWPSVSVIVPVFGVCWGEYLNFLSLFRQTYPGEWELLFVLQCDEDPAVEIVNRLRETFQDRKVRLVIPARDEKITDRMNQLIGGAESAVGQVLIFTDSRTRVPTDYILSVVEPLSDPTIGIVTAAGAWFGAKTVFSAFNCHLENLLGQSVFYALAFFDRLESANDWTMGIRRSVYEEIGGLRAVSEQVSDARALARSVVKHGYRINLLAKMVPVSQPHLKMGEWLQRTHRMAVIYKTYVNNLYPLFVLQLGFFHAMIYWVLEPGSLVGPTLCLTSLLGEIVSHLRMNFLYVKDRSTYYFIWLLPILLLAAPFLWATAYFSKVIAWKGQRYFIDSTGVATRLKIP